MPTLTRDGVLLVDGRRLVSLLRELHWPSDGLAIYLEDLPHHSQNKAAMRSMALNFGRLVGALEARLQCERVRITTVPAGNSLKGWQRAMLGKCPRGETKVRALEVARAIWPGQNWVPRGCRTPHDGIIDAALIAEHGRRLAV